MNVAYSGLPDSQDVYIVELDCEWSTVLTGEEAARFREHVRKARSPIEAKQIAGAFAEEIRQKEQIG